MSTILQQAGPAFGTSAAPRTATAALTSAPGAGRLVLAAFGGNKNSGTITQPSGFTKRGQYVNTSVSACLASASGANAGAWTWTGQAEGVVATFETDITGWTAGTPATYPNPVTDTSVSTITGAYGNAPSAGTVFAMLAVDSSWDDSGPFALSATLTHTGYILVGRFQGDVLATHAAGGSSFILLRKDVAAGESMDLTVSWTGGADQAALVMCHFAYTAGPTAPTVSAGADVTGHVATTQFSRAATENDNGATITSRAWTIQAGPAGVGTTIDTDAALTWTPTTVGSYTLRYSATNSVGTTPDDMTIQVVAPTRTMSEPWLGVDSLIVKTSSDVPGDTVRVAFSTSSGMTSPTYSSPSQAPDANGYSKHAFPALTSDTTYWYQVEVGGQLVGTAQQTRTLPAPGAEASFTFGFASCRSHTASEPNPNPTALADAVTRGIDLFIETGDIHYRDISTNTPASFRTGYDELFTRSNIANLFKAVPVAYTWSDHDFGGDASYSGTASKPAAQSVYRERAPHTTLPSGSGGIYHSFRVGRVRFIVLDTRSYRSQWGTTDDSSKTMLGAEQKTWLDGLLDAPDSPITVIVSDVPWHASQTTEDDHWGAYQTERAEIVGWISAAATQVIFLCGDAHMLAIEDGTNSPGGVPVYHAAALNRFTSTKGGPTYSGGTRGSQNAYGYVQVTDSGNQIDFTYSGYYDGGTLWSSHTTTVELAVTGTAAAALGGLTATATGVVSHVSGQANLGGLAATAAGVRTTAGTAVATLGGLTATAAGVRTTSGTAAAQLGGLTATAIGAFTSYLGATGPALNPSVWLVDRDTLEVTAPLPDWQSLKLSPISNSPGACELVIAAGAPGFTTVHDNVSGSPQRDQEIEVWLAGSPEHRQRWLLQQKEGDDLQPGMLWSFSGVGLEQLLAEVLVGPRATETQELIFSAATYGTILITTVQAAQARDAGLLDGITWDFTTTHDSAGAAWANTITDLKFAPDDTLLGVASAGPEEAIGEFAIGPDRVLRAWNFGTRGVDRSTGDTPLRLAAAANLTEASRKESSRAGDAATATLAKGAEGQYQWATDATAEAQRGRRVEVAVDAGQIASSGGVLAAAQGRLETMKTGVAERTHGVAFGPGLPIPGVDYDVADWGLSVTGNTATPQRITQWTVTFQPGERARGTVRTNDLVADRLVRLIRQLNSVKRGGAVVGTSTAGPDVDDGKAPAQVTGVAASSSAYLDADGATWAAVEVGWTEVTTNFDTTAADDVDGYYVQFTYTGGAPLPTGWNNVARVTTNACDFDGVVADQPISIRVAAVDRYGHLGAWSTALPLTSGADATPPPVPSTPVVESYLGILTATWDGLGAAGEARPPDFSHVEVHASTSSGFTPNRPLLADGSLDEDASTTYIDRLSGAGTMPSTVGNYGETWYAKLVAVDRNRNASTASAQDSAVLAQAGDGDVSALSIGKLTAGVMSALMTISGTIRTAASGSRVELDTNGFRCYLGSAVVLSFDIPSAALSILGKLTSGAGIGTGSTVVVDPAVAAVELYPNATAKRFRMRAWTAALTGGGTGPVLDIHALNTGGTQRGPFIHMEAVTDTTGLTWIGHSGTGGAAQGGIVKLEQGGSAVIGTVNGFVQIANDGTIFLVSDGEIGPGAVLGGSGGFNFRLEDGNVAGVRAIYDGGDLVFHDNQPGGTFMHLGGPSGRYKTFIIDHPTDPGRWLVHACMEGPTADVVYRGETDIVDGAAVIELPAYFEAATRRDGRQVQVTVQLPDEPLRRAVRIPRLPRDRPVVDTRVTPRDVPEHQLIPRVAASTPRDGRFRIACDGPDGTRVAWLVTAIRADLPPLVAEPLRAEVDVRGSGPYRWIEPGTGDTTG